MGYLHGADDLRLNLWCFGVQDEMVNERNNMKDAIDDERDIGKRNRPTESSGNLPNEQLQENGCEHEQDEDFDQPGHRTKDH